MVNGQLKTFKNKYMNTYTTIILIALTTLVGMFAIAWTFNHINPWIALIPVAMIYAIIMQLLKSIKQ